MTIEAMEVAICDLHCFNDEGLCIDAENGASVSLDKHGSMFWELRVKERLKIG